MFFRGFAEGFLGFFGHFGSVENPHLRVQNERGSWCEISFNRFSRWFSSVLYF